MARRRGSLLGLVGGALMALSLFLSQVDGPELGREDATYWGNARGPVLWIPVGVAVLTVFLAAARPRLAWIPASIWIFVAASELGRMLGVIDGLRRIDPQAYLPPWPWIVAFLGGGCAVVASMLERRRTRQQTDVTAFD